MAVAIVCKINNNRHSVFIFVVALPTHPSTPHAKWSRKMLIRLAILPKRGSEHEFQHSPPHYFRQFDCNGIDYECVSF